jgi:hypothetical protein
VLSMSALSAAGGVSVVAHGVHEAVLRSALVGPAAHLAPGPRTARAHPRDEHAHRVLARQSGSDPGLAPERVATIQDPFVVASFRQPVLAAAQRVLLPRAVVSSRAAA